MTTHLRGRAAQAGALLAVVVGGIVVAPSVALADKPDVTITNLPADVQSGGTLTMTYQVKARPTDGTTGNLSADITLSGAKSCSGSGCSGTTQVSTDGTSLTANLTMPTVAAGASQEVTISISVQIGTDAAGTASKKVTVHGADKPQTVSRISGKVKDQDGKAISGASVGIQDSAGHRYPTTTNGSGGYSFISSDAQPIAPGSITVGALKDGYQGATVTIQAAAGGSVSVPLTLKSAAAVATPTPTTSISAPASLPATDDATTDTPSQDAPAAGSTTDTKKASDDSGSGSMLFLVLGGLLVAAGIGAIVLVLMRRKSATSDDDGDDPTSLGSGSGGAVPPSQGRFNDATRVASPMAAGAAATMVTPRPAGGTLADAPTMVQQVEDEFPDPYGAPIPQQGGYQAAAGGWDNQAGGYGAGNGYADPTQYGGGQQQDDGYGDGTYGGGGYDQGGYAGQAGQQQQRYDEPTGMYRPEADGYDQGGYTQADQYAGYDDQGGNYQGGGYGGGQEQAYGGSWGDDQGNGYGPQAGGPVAGGGTYGAPQQQYGGGYDQGGAYGGGYDQGQQGGTYGGQGGYDQGQQGGGYDQGYGGYDNGQQQQPQPQQPSRHGGQFRQEQPSHPGQRREWTEN